MISAYFRSRHFETLLFLTKVDAGLLVVLATAYVIECEFSAQVFIRK